MTLHKQVRSSNWEVIESWRWERATKLSKILLLLSDYSCSIWQDTQCTCTRIVGDFNLSTLSFSPFLAWVMYIWGILSYQRAGGSHVISTSWTLRWSPLPPPGMPPIILPLLLSPPISSHIPLSKSFSSTERFLSWSDGELVQPEEIVTQRGFL